MVYSRKAMVASLRLLSLGAVLAASGCGGSDINPGDPCDEKGEQACSDNREMSCGDDGKWKVDEDCGDEKTCVVKEGGDADCE